ncbi:MAG: chromosomal replication initiator protein DnaA [Lachnospiraceae bacterium]|nr:chromosomal replication initiator protein DnaA [Lachnospiraceae bacterium]MBR6018640.1 chromosomal replication initiator protein DnaA [Lachnospiraceae bacterium]
MYSKQVLEDNWSKILEQTKIDYDISAVCYRTWLLPLNVYDIEDNILTIVAENPINMNSLNFIRDKYSQFIRTSIIEMLGSDYEFELNFILRAQVSRIEEERKKQQTRPDSNLLHGNQLNQYTFDNFIVGDNNNFAHAAALAVAEQPGEVYNPLFIYGGSGLGKTHLMYAIANYILQNKPYLKVLYVTCETFTNDLIRSIRSGGSATETFREKYRTNDILLIDDIQFIEGKESMQEEFFHTFNEMRDNGRQVVISSDKNPKDLKILDERLRSRFEWGLTVDVQPPSYETRVAILREKNKNNTIPVYDDVLEYIAQNINSNIRNLEGALTQVVSMSRLQRKPINLELAQEALKDKISPNAKKTITPDLILNVVAEHYEITSEQIRSKIKSRGIAYPRQIAMFLCRELTSLSFDEIGNLIGNRDHSTVHYAYNKVTEDMRKDPSIANVIDVLKKKLNPSDD